MPSTASYRKLAFDHYPPICFYCGFGIPEVLEVARLDGNKDNKVENLAILCANSHKMYDINPIPTEIVIQMRGLEKQVNGSKRMKDAGKKAAVTGKRRLAGKKAAASRQRRMEI